MRKDQRKPKVKKRVIKKQIFIRRTGIADTIVNIPLDLKTGRPIMRKMDVQERKKLCKGQHTYWRALLEDDRGMFYLREVIE